MATFIHQIELSRGIESTENISGYLEALVLLRWQGRPVGSVRVKIRNGILHSEDIRHAIEGTALEKAIERESLRTWLLKNHIDDGPLPGCSVVIPTRDRSGPLRRCIEAVIRAEGPPEEIIVVDNAPSDDSTLAVCRQYPVKYVREDRPGLNWARSRGACEAKEQIVVYIDDDIVVDRGWLPSMLRAFNGSDIAAVTGLLMPAELETDAQEFFELHGGHRRGFKRRLFDTHLIPPSASGMVGVGGNMAIRRELILSMRLFDCEMDCGTVTRSGGDTYAFYRLLAAGYSIVYEPQALAWHYHRRDYASLRETLKGYGAGLQAALTRELVEHREWPALITSLSWFWKYTFKRFFRSALRRPKSLPLDLSFAEMVGICIGPFAYLSSRKTERVYLRSRTSRQEEPARVY